MEARQEIADFLSALIFVYTMCDRGLDRRLVRVLARRPRALQPLLQRGPGLPARRLRAVAADLPRLPLRLGPIDFSPIVAILVLRIVGGIVVSLIAP